MIKIIAYKLFEATDENGLAGWPSVSVEIDQVNEQDYIDAGYMTDYIFNFEAYKESMQPAFDAWKLQYKPDAKKVKINNFTVKKENPTEPPFDIDFVSGLEIKLHRKSNIVKGECTYEEFYEDYTDSTYTNLVVREESVYVRDSLGFPLYKDVTVKYALEGGGFYAKEKKWRKYYSSLEQIQEGKTRRGNLVSNLQKPVMGLISLAMLGNTNATPAVILEGRRFLADFKNEFEVFISDSNKEIIKCLNDVNHPKHVTSANYSWIDFTTPYGFTIRQYLIGELSI